MPRCAVRPGRKTSSSQSSGAAGLIAGMAVLPARSRPAARRARATRRGRGGAGEDLHAGVLVGLELRAGGHQRAQRVAVVVGVERQPFRRRWAAGARRRPSARRAGSAGSGRSVVQAAPGQAARIAASTAPRRDGAGHPHADEQLPAGPGVLPHHVRGAVEQPAAARRGEGAGQVRPQRGRAVRVDLRRRGDRDQAGVGGVAAVPPPGEQVAGGDVRRRAGRRRRRAATAAAPPSRPRR